MYTTFLKRILDLLGAFVLLLLLSPFFLSISFVLMLANKGAIFFCQQRPGKGGKPFLLYKFKTMSEPTTNHSNDTNRITKIGNILRMTSLDEIPQLLNIIKGEMSFIGPRPLLMEYLPLYSENQFKRHAVLPGITGWAQVKGRNSIDWDERFQLDLYYIENQSFIFDLRIVLITVANTLLAKNIYAENNQLVKKFKGNAQP